MGSGGARSEVNMAPKSLLHRALQFILKGLASQAAASPASAARRPEWFTLPCHSPCSFLQRTHRTAHLLFSVVVVIRHGIHEQGFQKLWVIGLVHMRQR
jgi:hypothetical protein